MALRDSGCGGEEALNLWGIKANEDLLLTGGIQTVGVMAGLTLAAGHGISTIISLSPGALIRHPLFLLDLPFPPWCLHISDPLAKHSQIIVFQSLVLTIPAGH